MISLPLKEQNRAFTIRICSFLMTNIYILNGHPGTVESNSISLFLCYRKFAMWLSSKYKSMISTFVMICYQDNYRFRVLFASLYSTLHNAKAWQNFFLFWVHIWEFSKKMGNLKFWMIYTHTHTRVCVTIAKLCTELFNINE